VNNNVDDNAIRAQYSQDVKRIGEATMVFLQNAIKEMNYDKATNALIMGRIVMGIFNTFFKMGIDYGEQQMKRIEEKCNESNT
jgi:hypothetical protein